MMNEIMTELYTFATDKSSVTPEDPGLGDR